MKNCSEQYTDKQLHMAVDEQYFNKFKEVQYHIENNLKQNSGPVCVSELPNEENLWRYK
jgi:hypothetical protein